MQKIKTILPPTIITSGEDDYEEEELNNDSDYIEPLPKVKKRGRKKKYFTHGSYLDSWVTSTERRYKRNGTFRLPTYLTQSKFLKYSKNKDYFKKYSSANKTTLDCKIYNDDCASNPENLTACKLHPRLKDFELKSEISCNDRENNELCEQKNNMLMDNKLSNGIKQEFSPDCTEDRNEIFCTCIKSRVDNDMQKKGTPDQTDVKQSGELVESKPNILKRDRKISPSSLAINEKEIKSLGRKRKHSKGYIKKFKRKNKSYHHESISVEQNELQENIPGDSLNHELMCKTEKEETDIELVSGIVNIFKKMFPSKFLACYFLLFVYFSKKSTIRIKLHFFSMLIIVLAV